MDAGKLIKLLRVFRGIPQKKLAEDVGVSQAYLSQVESGKKNPSLTFLRKTSGELKVPLTLLLTDDVEQDPEIYRKLHKTLTDLLEIGIELDEKRTVKASKAQ